MDIDAVESAAPRHLSNEFLEDSNNRLKVIKRMNAEEPHLNRINGSN